MMSLPTSARETSRPRGLASVALKKLRVHTRTFMEGHSLVRTGRPGSKRATMPGAKRRRGWLSTMTPELENARSAKVPKPASSAHGDHGDRLCAESWRGRLRFRWSEMCQEWAHAVQHESSNARVVVDVVETITSGLSATNSAAACPMRWPLLSPKRVTNSTFLPSAFP